MAFSIFADCAKLSVVAEFEISTVEFEYVSFHSSNVQRTRSSQLQQQISSGYVPRCSSKLVNSNGMFETDTNSARPSLQP